MGWGMVIDKNKSRIVLGGEHEDLNIILDTTNSEQVTEFQYLGTIMEGKGTQTKKINNRIQKAIEQQHAMSNSS